VLHRIAFPVVSEWCQYRPRARERVPRPSKGVHPGLEDPQLQHSREVLARGPVLDQLTALE
jgi:hypothetical protein